MEEEAFVIKETIGLQKIRNWLAGFVLSQTGSIPLLFKDMDWTTREKDQVTNESTKLHSSQPSNLRTDPGESTLHLPLHGRNAAGCSL